MKQTYNELNLNGEIIKSNFRLVPGMQLSKGHTWVEYKPNILEHITIKRSYINDTRDKLLYEDIEYDSHYWQTDSKSLSSMSSSILLALNNISSLPSTWRTRNNIDVEITIDYLTNVLATISDRNKNIFDKARVLKDSAETCIDLDSLNKLTW